MAVVRAHARNATEDDWRRRLLAVAARGARSIASGSIAAPTEVDAGEVVMLIPDGDGETGRRVASAVLRELESGLAGFAFALGRSRRVEDPLDLQRAYNEALLALNVVEGDSERDELAYEETGTYQLLLPYMSDPAELKRFYDETVRPLVAYDEQYETDLLGTLATFLDCDANVNATASRLITHRHTIRYRFERVRELTGLDVSSTDGREKLSLGLKAMRVLGIAAPRGPATEPGAGGGRVPPLASTSASVGVRRPGPATLRPPRRADLRGASRSLRRPSDPHVDLGAAYAAPRRARTAPSPPAAPDDARRQASTTPPRARDHPDDQFTAVGRTGALNRGRPRSSSRIRRRRPRASARSCSRPRARPWRSGTHPRSRSRAVLGGAGEEHPHGGDEVRGRVEDRRDQQLIQRAGARIASAPSCSLPPGKK